MIDSFSSVSLDPRPFLHLERSVEFRVTFLRVSSDSRMAGL